MKGAIDDAGLQAQDVGYINAHGTGTPENDKMEHFGIVNVFGAEGAGKVAGGLARVDQGGDEGQPRGQAFGEGDMQRLPTRDRG